MAQNIFHNISLAADKSMVGIIGDWFLNNFLAVIVVLVVIGAMYLMYKLAMQLITQLYPGYEPIKSKMSLKNVVKKLYSSDAVAVEKEDSILIKHDYDGIYELDNNLPPWWLALFYGTILYAGVALYYNHFSGYGKSQAETYEIEMAKGEEARFDYLAKQANSVDETNVVALTAEGDLNGGAAIYKANCVACHGNLGQGGIGPNLTDKYWIHGGDVKNVFKTIKYGVTSKGMTAWQSQLEPVAMQKVASYVLSLQGTNPPNPKAPQGEEYVEEK